MTRLTSALTDALYRPTAKTLIVAGVYAVAAAALLLFVQGLPLAVRVPLALPLLLVIPGYAVVTALIPTPQSVRTVGGTEPEARTELRLTAGERLVLSVVASVAVVPAAVLVTIPVTGVGRAPTLVAITGLTLVVSALAITRLPIGTGPDTHRAVTAWSDRLSIPTDTVSIVAAGAVTVLLLFSAGLALTDGSDALGTEFYVVDESAADDGAYELRVDHRGDTTQRYTLAVSVHDGSEQAEADTAPVIERRTLVVGPDETGTANVSLSSAEIADGTRLRFALYVGDEQVNRSSETSHRVLSISVNGTEG